VLIPTVKISPLYLGIDFGTTNSSVAYIYTDPRHLGARYVPVESARTGVMRRFRVGEALP
jgi:fibrillarin-like rRNA methylase